jgi:hypothetical protein
MVIIMIAAILGGRDTGAPAIVHAWLVDGIVCNLAASRSIAEARESGRVVQEVNQLLRDAVVELSSIIKTSLRPLRWLRWTIAPADRVALLGSIRSLLKRLVNLITGTTLPCGKIFGRSTARWLTPPPGCRSSTGSIAEERRAAGRIERRAESGYTVFLDVEPPSPELRAQAVALAGEVGSRSQRG